ncbi:MAG: hypothetical protein C4527_03310 [Candidatus Omnitrophota bacterium]|jgi:plasmid stability protein|nr:MAG: hypothetical protein C4527_03310 [Candidatus Omnitrophota bacterium]
MSNLVIKNPDPQMIELIQLRAAANGISIDEEAKSILHHVLQSADYDSFIREVREIRASMPRQQSDSADLIREERDR